MYVLAGLGVFTACLAFWAAFAAAQTMPGKMPSPEPTSAKAGEPNPPAGNTASGVEKMPETPPPEPAALGNPPVRRPVPGIALAELPGPLPFGPLPPGSPEPMGDGLKGDGSPSGVPVVATAVPKRRKRTRRPNGLTRIPRVRALIRWFAGNATLKSSS